MVDIHERQQAGKTTYWFSFPGHAGSIKEAANRTAGISFLGGTGGNGRAGMSRLYDLEIAEPSQELYRQFVANYRLVCQEKASARKTATAEKTMRTLCDAVWERKIDQMTTGEVASAFHLTQTQALRILKAIAGGQSGDQRFVYNSERQGVVISDGSVFTYSPMDVGGQASRNLGPAHYVWFCS